MARHAKDRQHAVNGMPFQVRESAVANVGCVLVHDAVQNDVLATSVDAHLVSQVPARGRVLVRWLLVGKPSYLDFDAILLPHDFAVADFDQCIP
jgi:hypothetical protein